MPIHKDIYVTPATFCSGCNVLHFLVRAGGKKCLARIVCLLSASSLFCRVKLCQQAHVIRQVFKRWIRNLKYITVAFFDFFAINDVGFSVHAIFITAMTAMTMWACKYTFDMKRRVFYVGTVFVDAGKIKP